MADNAVMFGLSNVYYAPIEEDGTYGTPVAIKGAVNLALTRAGNSNTFYADNSPYFVVDANAGYTGTLEIARAEEAFLKYALGWEEDGNGVLLEDANAIQKPFALLYEVSSNLKPQRFAFYECTLSRPENEANTTTDTTTPDTQKLAITMTPKEFEYGSEKKKFVKGSLVKTETTATKYDGWFDTVVVPTKVAA